MRQSGEAESGEGANRSNSFDTQDAVYDTAWSELNENQLVAGCGDGSVKLFDVTGGNSPVLNWHEHGREVYATSWNLITKDTFATSSWDGSIKLVRDCPAFPPAV
jgi:peroxin-7